MQSICLFSVALVNREISFMHTVLGFALDTCCSQYYLVCKIRAQNVICPMLTMSVFGRLTLLGLL